MHVFIVLFNFSLALCFFLLSLSVNGGINGSSDSRTINATVPTVVIIKELEMDNIYWTAEQFDQMSSETFIATVEILGNIPDFSAEQLAVLSTKATKVHWRH